MKWKTPPVIKVYEALGAVADERVVIENDTANVYSSSGNKFYSVSYDPINGAIMTNDNGSYWKGYLGYPAIAYLFKAGVLEFRYDLAQHFKNIPWKDINTKFKNDFDKTLAHIFENIPTETQSEVEEYAQKTIESITNLELTHLGKKAKPPGGY